LRLRGAANTRARPIPLAGATVAGIIVSLVAFLHSVPAGIVVVVFFVVYQQVENHFLQPVIYGRTVQLSPLAVLVAVLVAPNSPASSARSRPFRWRARSRSWCAICSRTGVPGRGSPAALNPSFGHGSIGGTRRSSVVPFGRGRLWFVLACVAAIVAIAGPAASSAPSSSRMSMTDLETGVIDQLNAVRADHGLAALHANVRLATAASQHSREMAEDGYFDHNSVDGTSFSTRIAKWYPLAGYRSWGVAENLLWSSPTIGASHAVICGCSRAATGRTSSIRAGVRSDRRRP